MNQVLPNFISVGFANIVAVSGANKSQDRSGLPPVDRFVISSSRGWSTAGPTCHRHHIRNYRTSPRHKPRQNRRPLNREAHRPQNKQLRYHRRRHRHRRHCHRRHRRRRYCQRRQRHHPRHRHPHHQLSRKHRRLNHHRHRHLHRHRAKSTSQSQQRAASALTHCSVNNRPTRAVAKA